MWLRWEKPPTPILAHSYSNKVVQSLLYKTKRKARDAWGLRRNSLFCSNIALGIRRWPASLWLWSSFGDIDDLQGPFSRTSLRFLSHVFGENYEIVTLAKHYTCVVVVLLNNSFYGTVRPALCTPSSLRIVTHFNLHRVECSIKAGGRLWGGFLGFY